MTHRFLAILLAGVLALAALDGFELREEQSTASAAPSAVEADDSAQVSAAHGPVPYPPKY